MKDPKESQEQAQDNNQDTSQQQSGTAENANWDRHQQLDEEGNEVGPNDRK